jgi:hypothetical protein
MEINTVMRRARTMFWGLFIDHLLRRIARTATSITAAIRRGISNPGTETPL